MRVLYPWCLMKVFKINYSQTIPNLCRRRSKVIRWTFQITRLISGNFKDFFIWVYKICQTGPRLSRLFGGGGPFNRVWSLCMIYWIWHVYNTQNIWIFYLQTAGAYIIRVEVLYVGDNYHEMKCGLVCVCPYLSRIKGTGQIKGKWGSSTRSWQLHKCTSCLLAN